MFLWCVVRVHIHRPAVVPMWVCWLAPSSWFSQVSGACTVFMRREQRTKTTKTVTFVSIVASQFVTMFQMLGVMNMLSVAWPEPFATVIEMASVLNFKLEVLNVGCVVTTPPLHRYVANAFTFVVLTLCMVAIHLVHVTIFHFAQVRRAGIRQFTPALFGAVGTVFMAVIISICSAIVQPLQCDVHPNGLGTMRAYRQVICWGTEGEHKHMLIVGAVACLVPLAFFSMCVWAAISLPKRLQQGDTAFLHAFVFLFFRFRPGAHSYILVLLLRNLGMAVVPIIGEPASELFASCVVVTACVIVGVMMSPWAVRQANHLDVAMHTGLLFILFLAALQTHRADEVVVGNLLVVVFSTVVCAFPGCFGLWSPSLHAPTQEAVSLLPVSS